MADQLVLIEKQDRITILTINNPDRRNALSMEVADELAAAVDEIKADPGTLAVILTGAGKGFSSGGDITSMTPPEGIGENEEARRMPRTLVRHHLPRLRDPCAPEADSKQAWPRTVIWSGGRKLASRERARNDACRL